MRRYQKRINCQLLEESKCIGEGENEANDTIEKLQDKVHQLLEELDQNLDNLSSLGNLVGVLKDILNGSADDIMQDLEVLMRDEVLE